MKEYTGELHVRWFQFGAFCPLFRAHGRTWHLRLPWGWNTGELGVSEVANYTGGAANPDESELHNAAVEPICRKYLELRYRLMPYLYSTVRECCQTGMPIMRALWLHYPDDPVAVNRGDEYLWGRDILVARPRRAQHRGRSPPVASVRLLTEERSKAAARLTAVDLATLPLYVRPGNHSSDRSSNSQAKGRRAVDAANHQARTEVLLYEDDGSSFNYQKGEWMGIQGAWNDRQRRLTLGLAPGSRMLPPQKREIEVHLASGKPPRHAVFAGRPLAVKF